MIFKNPYKNIPEILSYLFKFPHLKTLYKGTIFNFKDIVSLYECIIKSENSCILFGHRFYGLEKVNLYTLDEVFTSNFYDFKTENRHPVIIDCGANIGLSILYFKEKHKNAIIHAFEPDTKNYDYLIKNIKSYGWEESVIANKSIVSDSYGFENFEQRGNAGSKIVQASENDDNIVEIEKIRLKTYIEELDKEIDFLKIDIEGSEFQVIPDLKGVMNKIKKMYIEFHCNNNDYESLATFIKKHLGNNFHFQISTNFIENENIYDALKNKEMSTYYNCFAVNREI